MWHITQDMTLEIVIDIGIDIDIDIDIGIDIGHWHWTLTLTLDIEIDIGFLVPHSLSVLRGYYSETWYCQSSTKSHSEGSIKWPTWLIVARCCFIAKWSNISTAWVAPGMSFYRHVLETQPGAIHCFVGALPRGWLPQLVFYPRRITEIAFTMFEVHFANTLDGVSWDYHSHSLLPGFASDDFWWGSLVPPNPFFCVFLFLFFSMIYKCQPSILHSIHPS